MSTTMRRATQERHAVLVRLLEQGVSGVETLAAEVGVSSSTVRRDLGRLQHEGRIARTYGGALVRERFEERSFSESEQLHQAAKARVAAVAFDVVPEKGTVFLDAGTTCLSVARLLADRGPRTVFTRGLEAAALLARVPGIEVAARAAAVLRVADASKLRPALLTAWLPRDPSWTLVTGASADPDVLSALRAAGIRVVTASGDAA